MSSIVELPVTDSEPPIPPPENDTELGSKGGF